MSLKKLSDFVSTRTHHNDEWMVTVDLGTLRAILSHMEELIERNDRLEARLADAGWALEMARSREDENSGGEWT